MITQNLGADQLEALSEEVGAARSLLVLCGAFRGVDAEAAAQRWPNLTLKKIPRVVLARCEWGRDDYSLNVANLPMAQPEPQADPRREADRPSPRPPPVKGREENGRAHCLGTRSYECRVR